VFFYVHLLLDLPCPFTNYIGSPISLQVTGAVFGKW